MIRINLLPFRAARKKEDVRRQISIYLLATFFFLIAGGYYFIQLSSTANRLEAEKKEKETELARYAAITRQIARIKQRTDEIRAKLDVISGLERNKTGPVLLLDEIAVAIPREKLWLRLLHEKKGILTIEGTAMDNDTVARFMTNLEKAEHILAVDLSSTKLKNFKKYELNVTEFVLTCKTYAYKEPPPPTGKKGA